MDMSQMLSMLGTMNGSNQTDLAKTLASAMGGDQNNMLAALLPAMMSAQRPAPSAPPPKQQDARTVPLPPDAQEVNFSLNKLYRESKSPQK